MCGYANGTLGKLRTEINLGYSGGSLYVGEFVYRGYNLASRDEMKTLLMCQDKEQIVNMLLEFVDNATEG